MHAKTAGRTAFLLSLLTALSFCAALLCGLTGGAGLSAPLMRALMEKTAPPETTGLPAEEYAGVCAAITDYLAGRADTFQYAFEDEAGVTRLCFTEREQRHMADCRALFRLCARAAVLLGSFCALCVLPLLSAEKLCFSRKGLAWGFGLALAAAAVLALWALADFSGLFVLFHRLAFTNDLWLMDPASELIVRLMPLGFFIRYAALIGGAWLAAAAAGLVLSLALHRRA